MLETTKYSLKIERSSTLISGEIFHIHLMKSLQRNINISFLPKFIYKLHTFPIKFLRISTNGFCSFYGQTIRITNKILKRKNKNCRTHINQFKHEL